MGEALISGEEYVGGLPLSRMGGVVTIGGGGVTAPYTPFSDGGARMDRAFGTTTALHRTVESAMGVRCCTTAFDGTCV